MTRNRDFFINSSPKRDRSFFVKEEKPINTSISAKVPEYEPVDVSSFVEKIKSGNNSGYNSPRPEYISTNVNMPETLQARAESINKSAMGYKTEMEELKSKKNGIDKEIKKAKSTLNALNGSSWDLNVKRNGLETMQQLKENLSSDIDDLQKRSDELQTKINKNNIDYEYDGAIYGDTFGGKFAANYSVGKLSEQANKAWNDYVSNPTQVNKEYAQTLSDKIAQFTGTNKGALSGNGLISKSLANYLPQFINQQKAGISGGVAGGLAGGVAAATVPAIAGQLGPQVALPEEIATVPAAFAWGATNGGKAGYVAGIGKYSYENMRGAAFKNLIDLGVDEQTAIKAANDEALISSMIEMADTGIDIVTLGVGKLIDLVGKNGIKAVAKGLAKEGAENVTESAIKKVLKALGKYGLNIGQEALEESTQEIISIANENRFKNGEGNTGKVDLAGEAIKTTFNLTDEEKSRVEEAGKEGAKIAALMGGAEIAGAGWGNALATRNNSQIGNTVSPNRTATQQNTQYAEALHNGAEVMQGKNENQQLALPSAKIYVDEQGNAMNTEQYSQLDVNPEAFRKRTALINDINKTLNLSNVEKADLLDTLNKAELTVGNEEGNNVFTTPTEQQEQTINYSPVNSKQRLEMRNIALDSNGRVTILPTQKVQETFQSAKLAGMTDVDMNKAIELNKLLQSGAKLEFYDANRLPQNVSADKAKSANGFYQDGTIWINKNSGNAVEQILGHELTHHLESTNSFTELTNTILDSNVFYDFLAKKGYSNIAEYKEKLRGMEYSDNQLDSEIVARFVEEEMFTDQNTINRLAKQNSGIVEKIRNWINNLIVSVKGTTQEKELRKIENMYKKALEQAGGNNQNSNIQYSIAGTNAMNNINDSELNAAYNQAILMSQNNVDNEIIRQNTGWFQDKNGDWKFEFSDKYMKLKENVKLSDNRTYKLGDILEHDILFMAYPQLANYKIEFADLGKANATFISPTKTILINPNKVKSISSMEGTLIHEIQHIIQKIEGFERGKNSKRSKLAYYNSLGEIEANNTKERFIQEKNGTLDRSKVAPESSKANPKHSDLERYIQNRKPIDKIKDSIYQYFKGGTDIYEEEIGNDAGKSVREKQDYKENSQQNSRLVDGRRSVRAGEQPAFSMPETDNQGRKLSKEQQEFFKDSKVRDKDGNLQVMYHFTNDIFNTIDFKKNAQGLFWFTDGKTALENGDISAPGLKPGKDIITKEMYVNMRKPAGYEEYDKYTIQQLKERGYDGILFDDGEGTIIGAVFNNANQVKNIDNTKPTSSEDIRYSMNPVEIAKNPPNIETGLDALKKAKKVKEGDSQSSFSGNISNQSIFDEKFTKAALDDKNITSYESITNKETLQKANDAINEQGQKWVDRFLEKSNGEMKATDIAGGFILMNRYQQVGDYESMIRVAEKLRKAGTQQGQTIQMFSVLGRMTPEGMTYYAQTELSKAYDEILKNKTQAWADQHADEFKLNGRDIEFIQRRVNQASKLPEGRDKYILLAEIAERIQSKIPPKPGEGLKAFARTSMLLNPKTIGRNILGNAVIVPNHIISDFVGTGIDKAISKKTGIRTTGVFDLKALGGAKKGLYESFDDFRRNISTREIGNDRFEIQGSGRSFYENHTGKFATTRNAINKALNGLDRVTGFLLEAGDRPFYETWFINSLNNQMRLNNVTSPTAEMIEIATDEALQRTWQDNNSYTKVVSSVRNGLNKLNVKGYGLGDMVMPFVKTPANLTKAVVDFSPLGAINAALKTSQFKKDLTKGVATAKQQREVVKAWSQVITGTLGMAIMTVMANAGVLSGGGDDDKDVRAFEQNILGIKPYSIKIGDTSYTYDWTQPLGTSAAMVTDTVKSLKNVTDTEGKVGAVLKGAQSGASVLLEQSFVSGIRNLFEEDNLINALIEVGLNEPSKFTPQFLGQIAQIQDDTARTSYVYNDIPKTAANKVKAKIPGLRQTLEPSVDVLGREVKTNNSVGNVMLNPANTAFARTTKGAEEMYRVYQSTGDKASIAQVAPYYFNIGDKKVVLTPKQRTQYQKTIGSIASNGVENLLNNEAYNKLPDTDKAEVLKELYSYGNAIAKEEASTSYLLPKSMSKIKNSGMEPEEYILMKYISGLEGLKKDEMLSSLTSAGYTKKEAEKFLTDYKGYQFTTNGRSTLPTLSSKRSKLPTLKK